MYSLTLFTNAESISNQITNNDFIITSGKNIVKKSNNSIVTLKGLNIGGWLFQTFYMSPIKMSSNDNFSMLDVYHKLDERGIDKDSLFDTYYANFITEYDLDKIAKTGANAVRVPFWWLKILNEDGTYKRDSQGNVDFKYLDWIVKKCEERGMYVILALHSAPGGQSPSSQAGASRNEAGEFEAQLFLKNDLGKRNRTWTVSLWKTIASHFSGNPIVAGYDILGEAWDNSVGGISSRHNDLYDFYNWIYKEIRIVDNNHIIFMESCWNLKEIITYGKQNFWLNVAYSPHDYPSDNNIKTNEQLLHNYFTNIVNSHATIMNNYNIPIYIGEKKSVSATISPNNALNSNIVWMSSNNNVATVNNGVITAIGEGTAVITARTKENDEINTECVVNVSKKENVTIRVDEIIVDRENLNLLVGETDILSAIIFPNEASIKDVIWESDNPNIVNIDSGQVTALENGEAIISVSSKENPNIKAFCQVSVINPTNNIKIMDE